MKISFSKLRPHLLGLMIVLAAGLTTRLYKLDSPLADWHSWRQADTASVTREFVKHHYPIWEPHFHDLSSIPNGLDNPNGYRMVEFPLVNYLIAQLLILKPEFDLVVTSRLVSIGWSLISIVTLYGIVYRLSSKKLLAWLSSLVLATLPYSIFYSRTILPEPILVSTQLVSLYFFISWLQARSSRVKKINYALSLIFFSLSLLLKPTALMIAPVMAVVAFSYLGFSSLFHLGIWAYGLLGVIPLLIWRQWIQHFPAGIPAFSWLLNGNGIRLRPAWWRWLFAERLAKLILGYWGVPFLIAGVVSRIRGLVNRTALFDVVTLTWTGCAIFYLVVLATGNVQHDYYQVVLTPVISLLVARGIWWLINLPSTFIHRLVLIPTVVMTLGLTYFMSWWEVKGYFNVNNPAMVAAGQQVDQLTPADAQVIAPYGGDTAFLFQTNRTGWPIGGNIDQLIAYGADYYVTTSYDQEAKELQENYQSVVATDQYLIIDLHQPTPSLAND